MPGSSRCTRAPRARKSNSVGVLRGVMSVMVGEVRIGVRTTGKRRPRRAEVLDITESKGFRHGGGRRRKCGEIPLLFAVSRLKSRPGSVARPVLASRIDEEILEN